VAVSDWSLPGYGSNNIFKFLSNINQYVNLTFITTLCMSGVSLRWSEFSKDFCALHFFINYFKDTAVDRGMSNTCQVRNQLLSQHCRCMVLLAEHCIFGCIYKTVVSSDSSFVMSAFCPSLSINLRGIAQLPLDSFSILFVIFLWKFIKNVFILVKIGQK